MDAFFNELQHCMLEFNFLEKQQSYHFHQEVKS